MSDTLWDRIDSGSRSRSPPRRGYGGGYRRRSITPPPARYSRGRYRSRSRSFSRSPPPPPPQQHQHSSRYRRRSPYRRSGPPMSRRIENSQQERRVYIGNLPYEVKWPDLKDFMRQAGEVLHADVLTLHDGRSKGCGVVEFATAQDAQHAIDTLSNQMLMGRLVYIREDREQEPKFERPPRAASRDRSDRFVPGGSGGGGNSGNGAGPGRQLFIGNLPYSTGWQDLKDMFKAVGRVARADINLNREGRSKGSGIVIFDSERDAEAAIDRFNGIDMGGRRIEVREDRFANESRGGGGGGGGGRDRPPPPPQMRSQSPMQQRPPPPVRNEFTDGAFGNGPQSDTIFVGNLPWSTTNQDLVELFETVGNVQRAEIRFLPNGKSAGSGVVMFDTPASSEIAISKFNGYNYGNRDLNLSYVEYKNKSSEQQQSLPKGEAAEPDADHQQMEVDY